MNLFKKRGGGEYLIFFQRTGIGDFPVTVSIDLPLSVTLNNVFGLCALTCTYLHADTHS